MTDLLGVALRVIDALDLSGVRYTIGGSMASSFSGEPRASIDVLSILIVQANRLDEAYLRSVAAESGLTDLLERAQREAAGPQRPS